VGQIRYFIFISLFLQSILASLPISANQLTGRDATAFSQAMTAMEGKDWVLAKSLLNGLYNQFPNNSVIKNNLAVTLFNQGELEKSQKLFSSIIEQNKLTATAYKNLKKLYSYSAAKTYSTGLNLLKPIELPQLSLLDADVITNQEPFPTSFDNFQAEGDNKSVILSESIIESSNKQTSQIGNIKKSVDNKSQQSLKVIDIVKTENQSASKFVLEPEKTIAANNDKKLPVKETSDLNWFAQQNQLNNLPLKTRKEHTKAKRKVENELLSRLEQWRNAQSSGNSEEYISMYKQNYSPKWEKRNKWLKDRKRKINKSNQVKVEIEKPRIFIHKLTFQPFILFKEKVSSEKYSKRLLKHLYWIKEEGKWVIEKETTIKKM